MKIKLLTPLLLLPIILTGCETVSSNSNDTPGKSQPTEATAIGKTAPPRILFVPKPIYPKGLFEKGINAKVIVEFVIDERGRPTKIKVVEASHPGFANNTIAAIKSGQFKAGTRNGEPVAVKVKLPFAFNTNDPDTKISRSE